MERMLITIKGHVHPNMIDPTDTTTRGADLIMKTTALRATKCPQVTGGATKKEVSIRAGSTHKQDDSKGDNPRYLNPSAEDILNGPCRIHYAYLDGKRVSYHLMRDCRTFIKLQEAMELN
jgi:hypothetical protein